MATETLRAPKPRAKPAPVLQQKKRSDDYQTPRVFDMFAGAKLWRCYGCGKPFDNTAPVLVESSRHGISHDLFHAECRS